MAKELDRVGKRSIVGSGTIIGRGGENIVFYPFSNFPTFSAEFILIWDEKNINPKTSVIDDNNSKGYDAVITLRKKWMSDNRAANFGLNFASDEENEYYFAYVFDTIGVADKYTFILQYNVHAQAKA